MLRQWFGGTWLRSQSLRALGIKFNNQQTELGLFDKGKGKVTDNVRKGIIGFLICDFSEVRVLGVVLLKVVSFRQ